MGQKYVLIPGIPQPAAPGIENQAILLKQAASVPLPQGHQGGHLQYPDPNFPNTGMSAKPLVGFSTSFSHVTAGPDVGHVLPHEQNYSFSYASQNYPSVWNARYTSPLLRGSSMSTCFLPPSSNNLFCRGSSFHSLRNDGSQSPVFYVLQSVGNFCNPQPCVLNPILCSTDAAPIAVNTPFFSNVNEADVSQSRSAKSHGNSYLSGPSLIPSHGESFLGNIGKFLKYITPVNSRPASPAFTNKHENESPLSTPPPQIISSPPTLASHVLQPESRIGYPVLFSPKTSLPPTPLYMKS